MPDQSQPEDLFSETWHVLGAGSLGGLWAVRLRAQVLVHLLLRQALVGFQTLRLHDGSQSLDVCLPAERSTDAGAPIRHLLVATKSYDTLAAIDSISHRLMPASNLYLMQNGLGSQEAVAEKYSGLPVYAITTTEGANQQARYEIVHAGRGMTWIGPLTHSASQATASHCAQLFRQVGFQTEATADIREKLWLKLAINCAINPFTALLDCPNGELPEQPFFKQRIDALCEEIAQAISLAGYPHAPEQIRTRVTDVIQGTAQNISSMLQDIRAERRTEIDAINGYLSDFCDRHQLHCPVNQELVQLVRARERV